MIRHFFVFTSALALVVDKKPQEEHHGYVTTTNLKI